MSVIGHVHEFAKPYMVRDFCHYSVTEKTCKICNQTVELTTERDFDLNPLQIAFARHDCLTCRRILKGSEPASWSAA
jgi:hypothetical protein